jgi:ribosomal protein S18
MNYWNKSKKINSLSIGKKRINWNQCLKEKSEKPVKNFKKSLQFLLLLKKFNNNIDYKNIKLLKAFLTKYGKIKSRRKTRISLQLQKTIANAIKRARSNGLIPLSLTIKV